MEVDGGSSSWRNYLRVRTKIDVDKPLVKVLKVSITKGRGRQSFCVKYKLPRFLCGMPSLSYHVTQNPS